MLTVTIPSSILNGSIPLLELGIVQNMTANNIRVYDESSDSFIFTFYPEDRSLVERVLIRMFGTNFSQINIQ